MTEAFLRINSIRFLYIYLNVEFYLLIINIFLFVSELLHELQRETFREVKLGFHKFHGLKPYYARNLKERNTCFCVHHIKIDFLSLGVNTMHTDSKGIHGDGCVCTCEVYRPNGEDKL